VMFLASEVLKNIFALYIIVVPTFTSISSYASYYLTNEIRSSIFTKFNLTKDMNLRVRE
jgi:hypothetical protein